MSSARLRAPLSETAAALRWRVGGRVQGVGYRPFVYRLAQRFELSGWVRNHGGEVEIHAQGRVEQLQAFSEALLGQAPPAAVARVLDRYHASGEAFEDFRIVASIAGESAQTHVPPDLFTCNECLTELFEPTDRRYRYPFINCTQCGPRYTLIRALPYDRPNTTLAKFTLCAACAAEYGNPLDRRFHAQPLACPVCGPVLRWKINQLQIDGNAPALSAARAALQAGLIVAARGVGGYHLLCDAANEDAVARLRARKRRGAKPFALMVPWRGADGLEFARTLAELSTLQATTLLDCQRPIVLLQQRAHALIAASVAPNLNELALMLPYSPLHHLLLHDFGAALVATSGNLSGEPVLTDPEQVEARLAGIADAFLHHDRPIARPADDPVVRVLASSVRPLRLGRGSAPLELRLARPVRVPTLAVGAYLKTTVALAWGDRAVVSPHIGELASPRGREVFAQVARDLQQLYGIRAEAIAHDAHPGFPNTRWALDSGLPTEQVWHHHAHAAAVAGEYSGDAPLLCFTWDGVGLGPDQTLWGGEGLLGRPGAWTQVASFRPFRLPGGERTARQPWRTALALCWESGTDWPAGQNLGEPLLRAAFDAGLNAPWTTAIGRMFDGAAALLGLCLHASYEAEAPRRLEALCTGSAVPVALPLSRDSAGVWRSDWAPLVQALINERRSIAERAAVFHASLAHALLDQALAVRRQRGVARVGLSGGVFQNRILTEHVHRLLSEAGFEVLIPRLLPLNDAAISFGQLIEAAAVQNPHAQVS
jgi:hydrogenase maturation protein HypF